MLRDGTPYRNSATIIMTGSTLKAPLAAFSAVSTYLVSRSKFDPDPLPNSFKLQGYFSNDWHNGRGQKTGRWAAGKIACPKYVEGFGYAGMAVLGARMNFPEIVRAVGATGQGQE